MLKINVATTKEQTVTLSHVNMGFYISQSLGPPHIRPLFRGDSRPYSHIFNEGFVAKGNNPDLLVHTLHPSVGYGHDSAYISTSSSPSIAVRFAFKNFNPANSNYALVYEIVTTQPTIYSEKALEIKFKEGLINANDFEITIQGEKEQAFSKKITAREIKGCWKIDIQENFFTQDWHKVTREFTPNPNYIPPITDKLWTAGKYFSHALAGAGLALDMWSLYGQYQIDNAIENDVLANDYTHTKRTAASIAGGWAGAYATGAGFAKAGAIACMALSPAASVACAVGGGIAGSMLGYFFGSHASTLIFDSTHQNELYLYQIRSRLTLNRDQFLEQSSFTLTVNANPVLQATPKENKAAVETDEISSVPKATLPLEKQIEASVGVMRYVRHQITAEDNTTPSADKLMANANLLQTYMEQRLAQHVQTLQENPLPKETDPLRPWSERREVLRSNVERFSRMAVGFKEPAALNPESCIQSNHTSHFHTPQSRNAYVPGFFAGFSFAERPAQVASGPQREYRQSSDNYEYRDCLNGNCSSWQDCGSGPASCPKTDYR